MELLNVHLRMSSYSFQELIQYHLLVLKSVQLSLLERVVNWLYTSTTCDLQLRIPTVHGDNYSSFREALILSIKGNDGFGGVFRSSS